MECLGFMATATAKIVERSPGPYTLIRAMTCFVPRTISINLGLAVSRMKELVQVLYNKNHKTAVSTTNQRCRCLACLIWLPTNCNSSSKVTHVRRDEFYYNIIGKHTHFAELFSIVRLVLTLLYDNASVESGFSVNADMLVENLHE